MKAVVLPELRFRRFWMLSGVFFALLIAILSLMPNSELPDLSVSDKFEHIMAYVLLAFWFASIVVRRDYLWLALALLGFGALIEVLQGSMGLGRSAELMDLGADIIGILAGMVLAVTPAGRWPRWLESLLPRAAS